LIKDIRLVEGHQFRQSLQYILASAVDPPPYTFGAVLLTATLAIFFDRDIRVRLRNIKENIVALPD